MGTKVDNAGMSTRDIGDATIRVGKTIKESKINMEDAIKTTRGTITCVVQAIHHATKAKAIMGLIISNMKGVDDWVGCHNMGVPG